MCTPRTLLQLWLQGLSYLNGGVLTEGQGRWATEVLNPMAHVHAGAPSLAVNTGGIRRPRSQVLPSMRWARVGRSCSGLGLSSSSAASIQALASSLVGRRLAEVGSPIFENCVDNRRWPPPVELCATCVSSG